MTRRDNKVRRQYTAMHTLCCIVFCVFIFLYLYFYQGDIMTLAQHVLSGGATSYDKLIGALVITAVMLIIHTFVYSLLRLDRWFYWLTYLPSFLVLAIITDVTPNAGGGVYNYMWLWLAPLIICIYVVMVRLFSEVDNLGKDNNLSGGPFSKVVWMNLLATTLMMLIVVGTGNTDVTFHYRIKVENNILAGQYDKALRVGYNYTKSDSSLTMLRAYALAVRGELPERLFEYPVVGGSSALYPDGKNVRSMMIHNGDIIKFIRSQRMGKGRVAADYKLCGDLADCRLEQFAADLPKYYAVDSLLPRHYKEALFIVRNYSRGDTVSYADKAMVIEYDRFLDKSKNCKDKNELRKELEKHFSGTYWYYYACNSNM